MITIISGTNRDESRTLQIAHLYRDMVEAVGTPAQIIDLAHLPGNVTGTALYANTGKNEAVNKLAALLRQSDKFVFIVPEYNGSFPGILKVFIDALEYPNAFAGKKAGLVGLGKGMMGGTLALSHLSDIMSYLNVTVLPLRARLAFIDKHLNNEGLHNELYATLLRQHAAAMAAF